jgi:VanZ family protein
MPKPGVQRLSAGLVLASYAYFIAKSLHVAMYTVMAFLSALVPLSARHRFVLLFVLMAHAAVTELLQEILEPYCNRGGSLLDVCFDHLGIALGIAISWKWWTRGEG